MKNKLVAVVLVVVFMAQLLPGGMLTPSAARAYDVAEDQGHGGGVMPPPKTTPAKEPCPPKGSPVNVRNGEFSHEHQDLLIPGRGLPLQVVRSYNSHETYDGPFGYGWGFNLEIRLLVTFSGSREVVTIRRGDGLRLDFTRNADGSYEPPKGRLDQLVCNVDGSYTWTEGRCSTGCGLPRLQFDAAGYLLAIEDPNGNRTAFAYDASGKLKTLTDAVGRKLGISYGGNNKIASITDPGNRTFTYGYSAGGDLISTTDPMGQTTTYSYDGNHHLTGITDARGNQVAGIVYDAQDRVVSYTENGATYTYAYYPSSFYTIKTLAGTSSCWTFSYNASGQLTAKRDPKWNSTTYYYDDKIRLTSIGDARNYWTTFEYDERGNRTGITDALGNKTTLTYDSTLNKIATSTDALGRTTSYTYDDRGNLITVTDALGNKTTMTYNAFGQLIKVTSALGFTTSYTYDTYGNLKTVTDALGNVVTYTHDILGNLTKVVDTRGNSTLYVSDAQGRFTEVTDALGSKTHFAYDANGNVVSVTDALNRVTGFSYDNYNRLIKIVDPLGHETIRSYDVPGNLTGEIDANGNASTYTYDAAGFLVKQVYADGTAINTTYDANGNTLSLQDPKGNATTYSYDALNRPATITYADASKESFSYDPVGNLAARTDQKGNSVSYTYNALDQLIAIAFPDGARSTFKYDPLGRMSSAENDASQIAFTYDRLNRIIKTVQDDQKVSYGYDKAGNRTKMVYPSGYTVLTAFDALSRVKQIQDSANKVLAAFSYDKQSRLTKLTYGSGMTATFQYDNLDRLTDLTHRKGTDGAVLASFKYGYDAAFSRTSLTTKSGKTTYSYDKRYQLTQAVGPGGAATTYNFDGAGNRATVVNGGVVSYSTNKMNQYTDVSAVGHAYDANGNLTADGIRTYQYDHSNALTQVTTPDDAVKYAYDALGRRISKSVDGVKTRYVYDGERVISEVRGGSIFADYFYGQGIDEVLGMVKPGGGGRFYFHLDGLGSVSNITNATGGAIESYSYDAFGKPTIKNADGKLIQASSIGNVFMFTGRDYDREVALYNYRARFYSPNLGRFIQMDPAGQFVGGDNLYAYAGNNPINLLDPMGLYEWGYWKSKFSYAAAVVVSAGIVISSGGTAAPLVVLGWGTAAGTTAYIAHEAGQRRYAPETLPDPCNPEGWGWVVVKGVGTGLSGAFTGMTAGQAGMAIKYAGQELYVIGRLKDTWPIGRLPFNRFNVLNIKEWTFQKNMQWVQNIIQNRAKVRIVSPETAKNLWDASRNSPTVFAEEIKALTKAGYRRVGDWLLPP